MKVEEDEKRKDDHDPIFFPLGYAAGRYGKTEDHQVG